MKHKYKVNVQGAGCCHKSRLILSKIISFFNEIRHRTRAGRDIWRMVAVLIFLNLHSFALWMTEHGMEWNLCIYGAGVRISMGG